MTRSLKGSGIMGKIHRLGEIRKDIVKLWQQLAQNSQLNKRAEILDIYEEYNKLPPQVQKDLPLIDCMDFHPKLQKKNNVVKKQYLEVAYAFLAQGACKRLHEEFWAVSSHSTGGSNLK